MLQGVAPIVRRGYSWACTAVLVGLGVLSGCTNKAAPVQPPAPLSGPYVNVVVIGDSLSAGFQNGSLLDTQQLNGWSSLLAQQAQFPLQLPLVAAPGAPAVLQLLSAGPPPVVEPVSGTTAGRDNILIQPTDLAVPGQTLHQLINLQPTLNASADVGILTDLVLGAPIGNTLSQLGEAIALKPSTIFLWIGTNDALPADVNGDPSTMTSIASFSGDYAALISSLKTNTQANLVVANIPDVTRMPYMTPGSVILSEAAQYTGLSQGTVASQLGLEPADLVNGQGLTDLEYELAAYANSGRLTPLANSDVLTAAEIVTTQNTIAGYNQVIAGLVAGAGGTLVDLNAYFAAIGDGITINGYAANRSFLGGLFSLDGVHPTNTAYALFANQYIAATNSAFRLSVPFVNVSQIAANDPYFGANVRAASRKATHIPSAAARQAGMLVRHSAGVAGGL